MRVAPVFRPQALGAILVTALRLYRRQWWSWMGIVVLCYAPVVGLMKLWQHTRPFAAIPSDFERAVLAQVIAQLWWFLGTGTLLTATVVAGLASAYHGEAATVGSCYRVGLRRVGVLLAASLLPLGVDIVNNVILLLAHELAIVIWLSLPLVVLYGSGVWLEAHMLFVPQISVLEQRRPFHVLQRSWYLARLRIRRTIVLLLLTKAAGALVTSAPLYVILSLPAGWMTDHRLSNVFLSTYYSVAPAMMLPLQLAIYTVLYYDLRIRHEAYARERPLPQRLPEGHVNQTPA